ncbi:hypothetical protein BaRGS_00037652 [Batillaria attramentaria]|uniref:Uncharacterized protein n=1 Tax=Batillaria attramentaria TaxID=370345 RepID=A0ABD0J886_9CAEN
MRTCQLLPSLRVSLAGAPHCLIFDFTIESVRVQLRDFTIMSCLVIYCKATVTVLSTAHLVDRYSSARPHQLQTLLTETDISTQSLQTGGGSGSRLVISFSFQVEDDAQSVFTVSDFKS